MKTLILIILLYVVVQGQNTVVSQTGKIAAGFSTTDPIYPIDYFSDGKHHDVIAGHLLTLLDDYSKDCYADSAKVDRLDFGFQLSNFPRITMDKDSIWRIQDNPDTLMDRFYWSHRDMTLKGFINWLKKRQGETK